MKKSLKETIKGGLQTHLPRLWKAYCFLRTPSVIKEAPWMREKAEKARFRQCIKERRPYFGPIMAARQGVSVRHAYMRALVEEECARIGDGSYRILEIGSWAGGSAITWASAVQSFNKGRGCVVCVDPWESYVDNLVRDAEVYQAMDAALKSGDIFNLFLHNIRSSGFYSLIKVMRGQSGDILPLLKPETFDLVFVDGAHDYASVVADLKNASPLVRDGGILCGDDLELQTSEVDMENARNHSASDYVCDPRTSEWFHPGVTLAIGERFGLVSVWQGFWAMRKTGTCWQKVKSSKPDAKYLNIPSHLKSA
ncbi:MAG: class I SAM-dependent methyltransferase [Verrucomicrobia bacterium]|nr:class I SAM-dependent methyltransferase [Verrucomicrobiota bacterium]